MFKFNIFKSNNYFHNRITNKPINKYRWSPSKLGVFAKVDRYDESLGVYINHSIHWYSIDAKNLCNRLNEIDKF